MYKLLFKDALDASQIQPYLEVDLCLGEAADIASLEEEPAVEAAAILELSALGPLVCLIAAQDRAGAILAEARREAEALKRQAYEEGKSLGGAEARSEILPALTSLAQAGQSLIVFEERMVGRFTPELVRLALEIAEKIVGKALAEDPAIVASVLERARREVPDARLIRVRLHPADYRLLIELKPELVRMGEEAGRKFEVLTSEDIPRGGCRIETEIGVVDATIPTQVEEIQRQLLDE